jgi:hypothetical protein
LEAAIAVTAEKAAMRRCLDAQRLRRGNGWHGRRSPGYGRSALELEFEVVQFQEQGVDRQ